jgi:hypothetical protein
MAQLTATTSSIAVTVNAEQSPHNRPLEHPYLVISALLLDWVTPPRVFRAAMSQFATPQLHRNWAAFT